MVTEKYCEIHWIDSDGKPGYERFGTIEEAAEFWKQHVPKPNLSNWRTARFVEVEAKVRHIEFLSD